MSLLDQRAAQTDQADLAIIAIVETICDQKQPATASAVCSLIGGAPARKIAYRLSRLHHLGLLDEQQWGEGSQDRYRVSAMGAELCARELIGWSPSISEQRRRDSELLSAGRGVGLLLG